MHIGYGIDFKFFTSSKGVILSFEIWVCLVVITVLNILGVANKDLEVECFLRFNDAFDDDCLLNLEIHILEGSVGLSRSDSFSDYEGIEEVLHVSSSSFISLFLFELNRPTIIGMKEDFHC